MRGVQIMMYFSSSKSYDSDQFKNCPSHAISAPAVGFLLQLKQHQVEVQLVKTCHNLTNACTRDRQKAARGMSHEGFTHCNTMDTYMESHGVVTMVVLYLFFVFLKP